MNLPCQINLLVPPSRIAHNLSIYSSARPSVGLSFCQGPIFASRFKKWGQVKNLPPSASTAVLLFLCLPEPHFPTVNVPLSFFREERMIFNETVAAAAAAAQINGDGDKIHSPPRRHPTTKNIERYLLLFGCAGQNQSVSRASSNHTT